MLGLKAGDHFNVTDQDEKPFTVVVPNHLKGGDSIYVVIPDAKDIPRVVVQNNTDKSEPTKVIVPQGLHQHETFHYALKDGRVLTIVVPEGLHGGSEMDVVVPTMSAWFAASKSAEQIKEEKETQDKMVYNYVEKEILIPYGLHAGKR